MFIRRIPLVAVVFLTIAFSVPSGAQEVGYVAAVREIRREASGRRALFVAARDDAVDGPTLAWLADGCDARTTIVVVSRPRAPERLVATARELSADLRSLDQPPVGLARTAGEVNDAWRADEATVRLAAIIRSVRPHVILVGRAARPDAGAFDAAVAIVTEARVASKTEAGAVFVFDASGDLEPDVRRVDALRGRSYGEIGGDPAARPRYRRLVPETGAADPFEGVAGLASELRAVLEGDPENLAERLARADRLGAAFCAAIGLRVIPEASRREVTPGETFDLRFTRWSRPGWGFTEETVEVAAVEGWSFERTSATSFRVVVDDDVGPTGALDAPLTARWSARLGERAVSMDVAVPVRVVARLEFVGLPPDPIGVANNVRAAGRLEFPVDLRNRGTRPLAGALRMTVDPTHPDEIVEEVEVAGRGVGTTVHLEVPLPADFVEDELEIVIVADFPAASLRISRRVRFLDVTSESDLQVGLVDGRDASLRRGLTQLGVEFERLGRSTLRGADLLRYDTIVIDRDVLAQRDDVREARARLLAYVEEGGHLVVLSQPSDVWKRIGGLAPLKIDLGEEFTSFASSAVTVDDPDHLLLNRPNELGVDAWRGWTRERGRNFPVRWHPSYAALVGTSDPGEPMLVGGLLVVESGKGSFVYTPLSIGPQLDAAVAGAYRLLANLVSYPLVKRR